MNAAKATIHSATRIRPLLLLALLLLSACASTRYEHDFRPGTDFSGLQTYIWRSSDVQIPGVDIERLQSLADDALQAQGLVRDPLADRKSTRLNSSHVAISYAVFCLKKKKKINEQDDDKCHTLRCRYVRG